MIRWLLSPFGGKDVAFGGFCLCTVPIPGPDISSGATSDGCDRGTVRIHSWFWLVLPGNDSLLIGLRSIAPGWGARREASIGVGVGHRNTHDRAKRVHCRDPRSRAFFGQSIAQSIGLGDFGCT